MQSDKVDQLIDVISREAVIFEEFLESLERQKEMLVKNDAEGLQRVTEFQRQKIFESQTLNRERQSYVSAIQAEQNIEGDLNVSRLLSLVDESQADQLSRLSAVILTLNDKITESRNRNVLLLNRSREYISKMMQMLSKLQRSETYSGPGTSQQQAATIAMDRRA